jgi:hypothetical protein
VPRVLATLLNDSESPQSRAGHVSDADDEQDRHQSIAAGL